MIDGDAPPTGYLVDRVVVCDAFREPDRHYQLLRAGKSRLVEGRRPSMRFLASAKATKGGIAGVTGKQEGLFEDFLASEQQLNDRVNEFRSEVRAWREDGYPETALITSRLLEWWFERDEERRRQVKRFFFCQREAIETVIYLFEVKHRYRMPETGDLVRYALKLATGTGKTLVMALIVVWATLHKKRVAGSGLSANFLVIVPNLTVRDRVWGTDQFTLLPTGAGLNPDSAENLYDDFDLVPPEHRDEFRPNVLVRNWQSIPLEVGRDDWIGDDLFGDGRFVPASVVWALQRRARVDPAAAVRRLVGKWRDAVIINDEAHHAWGEKKAKDGEVADWIVWSRIIEKVRETLRVPLVVDLSATPWYGTASAKPDGTLFEWLVSDFSVYDAFESGLVKVVRLPDPSEEGHRYLNLWDFVSGAKTKEEYLSGCKGAIVSIYSNWRVAYDEWAGQLAFEFRGPPPVMLVVADRADRAKWLFEHLTKDYEYLRNPDSDDPRDWVTIQVDSKVFDAEKGREAVLREMVNTVGRTEKAGQDVRCIISVNMLSEGWDVKNVTHMIGLRAFGSALLTEQMIGRGLRRVDYSALNIPIEERLQNPNRPDEETVDAFGIPFVGFPVERRKRPKVSGWSTTSTPIAADPKKGKFEIKVPNVRSWAVGVSRPLVDAVPVSTLPELTIDPKETPPEVEMRPVVGGQPETVLTIEEFRREHPLLDTKFLLSRELLDSLSAESDGIRVGPTFEELLEFVSQYLDDRVTAIGKSERGDVGMYYWRQRAYDILRTAVQDVPSDMVTIPIYGDPPILATGSVPEFKWPGIVAVGKKTHWSAVPCHGGLELDFAAFLDAAADVTRYVKNERLNFSVTYYEGNRARQYFPDFITVTGADGGESWWLVETKGEVHQNTVLKSEAAQLWCDRMTRAGEGSWRYLFVQQVAFERARLKGVTTLSGLAGTLMPPAE